MNPKDEKQAPPIDGMEVRVRMVRLGLTGRKVAKRLNRTNGAISQALNGANNGLLQRVDRYVSYVERKQNPQQGVAQSQG